VVILKALSQAEVICQIFGRWIMNEIESGGERQKQVKRKDSGMIMEVGHRACRLNLLFYQRGPAVCWIDDRIVGSS
jgi:hypothetical protein